MTEDEKPKQKANESPESKTDKKPKSKVKEIIESIIIAILIALFIRTFIICAYKIPSRSMVPTLLVGDHLLVNKFMYGIKIPLLRKTIIPVSNPQRGDIVVFIFPDDRSKDFIKRVIGVSGDKIEIKNKKIFINDKEYKDSYGVYSDNIIYPSSIQTRDNFGPVTVPEKSIFVMGDNRDESLDSRFWGFVPLKDVEGKAFIIYWSWNREDHNLRWQRLGNLLH
ncbi:signal peptidase i [hydrocarbon metagenome]|uniref:signal peptidase I n=1 Tax=hydrocarbon metagenome TaxID=938273 RepID=A0A0W8FTK5_9ZZZZ